MKYSTAQAKLIALKKKCMFGDGSNLIDKYNAYVAKCKTPDEVPVGPEVFMCCEMIKELDKKNSDEIISDYTTIEELMNLMKEFGWVCYADEKGKRNICPYVKS